MKKWILNNLTINDKLVSKRINEEWFMKNGYGKEYNKIIELTQFLETNNINQRIWHIVNNIYEEVLCGCGNKLNFIGYWKGYTIGCSLSCAQKNPQTMNKIKNTNLRKYGVEYPQQSDEIKKKSKNVLLNKYGVDNISQVDEIKMKKEKTLFNNYGTKNIFDLATEKIIKRYGTDNAMKNKDVQNKSRNNRLKKEYKKLFNSDRFLDKVVPMFDVNDYDGVYGGKIYSFMCNKCENIFESRIEKGRIPRCLTCYPTKNNSMFQREVIDYVKSIYLEKIIENDRNVLNGLELDIYLPEKKFAVECNGLYYHSEISGNKDKNYHLNKTVRCENKGIQLIHIFEDEWLSKSDVVKRRLKNLLGLSQNKIYARKCEVREINSKIKNEFLNSYHIQGEDKSKIKLGLFYNENLVAVMTFGNRRLALGKKITEKGEFELIRYATSHSVTGGAGKLLSYFIKNYQPTKIISYADRRWSTGNLYETLGFNKLKETSANYWYLMSNGRNHRFNFRKNVLNEKLETFDKNLTEWQNMQLNGYDRIWDCGNLKYELKINN